MQSVVFWKTQQKLHNDVKPIKVFDGIRQLDRLLDNRLSSLRNYNPKSQQSQNTRKRELLIIYKSLAADLKLSSFRMLELAYYGF